MAAYKYDNGMRIVTTDIHAGYKRFKSRNAQYAHNITFDEYKVETWDFVSYAYPIMSVSCLDGVAWDVFVTRDCLECSRTTTQQIGAFLKYIGCPVTISDIRETIVDDYECNYIDDGMVQVIPCAEVNSRFTVRF